MNSLHPLTHAKLFLTGYQTDVSLLEHQWHYFVRRRRYFDSSDRHIFPAHIATVHTFVYYVTNVFNIQYWINAKVHDFRVNYSFYCRSAFKGNNMLLPV